MTVEVTVEVTAEVTETVTATPTITPTASATPLPPEPDWVLVSSADFEQDVPSPGWFFVGWDAQTLDGAHALGLRSFGGSALFAGPALLDNAVQVRVRLSNGIFALGLRQSAADGYTATFEQSGFLRLYRSELEVAQMFLGPIAGQWRTLRLSAAGDVVRVSLDGAELITFVDTAPLPAGQVTLGGQRSRESRFAVDDLTVWAGESEAGAPAVLAGPAAPMGLAAPMALGAPDSVAGRIPSALAHSDLFAYGSNPLTVFTPDGQLASHPGLWQASMQPWSPDGQWLLVRAEGDDGLRILNPFTGEVRTLTSLPELNDGTRDECPAWSPDSQQVVFLSRRRDGPVPAPWWGTGATWYPPALYVVATDGLSAPHRIALSEAQGGVYLGCPQWSSVGNGRQILSLSSGDIYSVDALTGDIVSLYHDGYSMTSYVWDPFVLSQDGTKVAFGRIVASIDVPSNVSVLDLQTGAVITAAEEMYDGEYPEWNEMALYTSWDWDSTGTRLAIGRDDWDHTTETYALVYRHDIIISDLTQPCPACAVESVPNSQRLVYTEATVPPSVGVAWSPDGRWIAAAEPLSGDPGMGNDLYAQLVLLDPVCEERLIVTEPFVWNNLYFGGGALISWQPLGPGPNAPMAFSSGGDYCLPVPTPTPTSDPTTAYYEQFKGIIFWAIYNETNGNQQVPLYEALPGTVTSIPNSLTDRDHRYLMTRTILNNIPLGDVSEGVAYMRRWGGSIANTNYRLWLYQQGRISCVFEGEPVALSYAIAAGENNEAILRWFNGYMECLRLGQPLQNQVTDFDEAYDEITGFIDNAITDHVNANANPVLGAQFVKHTSSCFVWQRGDNGGITSCHGDQGRINMQSFCNQSPYVIPPSDPEVVVPTPVPNRNCQVTSINPSRVNVGTWLASAQGQNSNQQLGLETVVGVRNLINLGLYTDDQPYSCGFSRCYFLLGNPTGHGANEGRRENISETSADAWQRHEAAQMNPEYGYRGFAQSYLVHVLWTDRNGVETWITTVFQQGGN